METKFTLRVHHKTYKVNKREAYDFDNHVGIYMDKYVDDITKHERDELTKQTKYVRIMSFQDRPDTPIYIKCYCRDISEMTPEHRADANAFFAWVGKNYFLVEINYATTGVFHACSIDELI